MRRKLVKLAKGERKRIRRLLKRPNDIQRFELHTALGGVYEISARLRSGSRIIVGSEVMKEVSVNGINKLKIAEKAVRILNRHWNFVQ